MIKYKVEDKETPTTREVKYPISRKEVYRIRQLLNIQSFEDWDEEKLDKLGIVKESCEYVLGVAFDDGATLDYKLCCGEHNYYDEVLFQYPDGKYVDFEPTYELDDIEIDAGSTIYIVRLEVQDE